LAVAEIKKGHESELRIQALEEEQKKIDEKPGTNLIKDILEA